MSYRYMSLENIDDTRPREKICLVYENPINNRVGMPTDDYIINAFKEKDCKIVVWRSDENPNFYIGYNEFGQVKEMELENKLCDFDLLSARSKENLLMETAMMIQETFDDMWWNDRISLGETDSLIRIQMFRDWAREFEEKYYGTERYEDDYLNLCEEFAREKIEKEFM